MRQKLILMLLALVANSAAAKTKIDIPDFADSTKADSCRAVDRWKDIGFAFKQQLVSALNSSGRYSIVESELFRGEQRESIDSNVAVLNKTQTFRPSNYSLVGQINTFNVCDTEKGQTAKVEIEVQIVNVETGSLVQKLTGGFALDQEGKIDRDVIGASFNSGLFRESAVGQATQQAIINVASEIQKVLPAEREVASASSYKVKIIHRRRPR